MSEANLPRTLPGPRVQDIAKAALLKIMDSEKGVPISLPLPEGCPELWVVVSRFRRFLFGRGLRVALPKHGSYCQRCREDIEKVRGQETQDGLAYLLQDVISIIQQCNCTAPDAPAQAAASGGEQVQPSPRINQSGNRVKIVSASESATPSSGAQETIRLTKSRGVTVVEDGGAGEHPAEGPAEKFTAPSIRFHPSSNAQVEVTIPRYVCEALVHHCGESNLHKKEVGGVLIGYQGETQEEGSGRRSYINVVTDLIPFKPSDSSGAHLRLDADSWVHISNIYEERYQPLKKVRLGWYHTHPTQGIFFSTLDHDFHTNFNQPFQFAIVVNPRNMEAGLIYWKNYEGGLTEGPITFSLKRRNQGSHSDGGAALQGLPEVESPPVSLLRIFFFTFGTLAVIGYIIRESPPFSLSPGNACLLALNALLGLRLLNASFFRPSERLEDRAGAVLREWWRAALDKLELALERYPRLAYVGVLVIILLTALLMLKPLLWPQRTDVSTDNRVGFQAGLIGGQPLTKQPRQDDGRLHLNLVHGAGTLSLSSDEGLPRVTFRKTLNGRWEPLDPRAEKNFLRYVLKLEASVNGSSEDVRLLQRQLNAYGGAGIEADGIWGSQIRNALLNELIKAQKESSEWALPSREGKARSVIVKGATAPDAESPRAERSSSQAAPGAPRRAHPARRRR